MFDASVFLITTLGLLSVTAYISMDENSKWTNLCRAMKNIYNDDSKMIMRVMQGN